MYKPVVVPEIVPELVKVVKVAPESNVIAFLDKPEMDPLLVIVGIEPPVFV